MRTVAAIISVPLVVGSWGLYAQRAANGGQKESFEVASVKPNKSGVDSMRMERGPNGRFQAIDITLRELIENSYNLRSFQLIGGPDWLDADRFDIVATIGRDLAPSPDGPSPELLLMIRNLLAERFKLRAHSETREAAIYALVTARADHKLGPRMKMAAFDCAALIMSGAPAPVVAPGQLPPCGTRGSPGKLTVRGGTMTQLVRTLGQIVEKIVIDKTELRGGYDLDLEWASEQAADNSHPSFFTALQEQLGLRLESMRGPIQVLVIDSVEQPTAD